MNTKADHVRAALRKPEHRHHTCHWPGCAKQVPPAAWGCRPHWFALPIELRNKVWAAYRVGQEDGAAKVSSRYIEVARDVQAWINEKKRIEDANAAAYHGDIDGDFDY